MNVRLELDPKGFETGVQETKTPIHGDYKNADKTTENQLIQDVFNNPEQKYDRFARDNKKFQDNESRKYQESVQIEELHKEIEQASREFSPNSDQKMREALVRFKAEQAQQQDPDKKKQMESDWKDMQSSQEITLQKKQERLEKRTSPESTSKLALGSQFAKQPEGLALQKKESEVQDLWNQHEKKSSLQNQLTRIQEALNLAHKTGDVELTALLEEQEENLKSLIEKETPDPISLEQKIEIGKVTIETQNNDKEKKIRIPDSMVQDIPFTEVSPNQKLIDGKLENSVQLKQQIEPTEETLAKLHEFGIKYEDLVQVIPNFANLSEGQQAYVLIKAQEQSLEHIQDKANTDFVRKQQESGFFKKIFKGGAMRREANRNAVNQHKGLNAFADDIEALTNYTIENGIDISIQENGTDRNYVIEYAKKPEGLTEKQEFFVDTYNRYATALSEIPYEWSLSTATKDQKKQYQEALGGFHQSEKALQGMLEKEGLEHNDVLQATFGLRAKVELNQMFSNNKDVAKEISEMKNATWQSDLTKKILQPGGVGILVGSSARLVSKSLWGLGGAAGASAIIGGWMGIRRKNQEFKQDSKDARRGKDLKNTTDKVFDAKQNAERIAKLLVKIENETNPKRREKSMQALEDRLLLLDERMKEGRVNFGKSKQQLENKTLLVEAMVEAQKIRYQLSGEDNQDKKQVNSRVESYFDKQDSKTKQERNKDRAKAFALGAGVGAGAATASWFIADWFNGDKASTAVKAAMDGPSLSPIESIPSVEVPSNPTDFEISVDASSKGAIETYANLQNEILNKYPDPTQAPEHIQEFLAKSPTALAMEDNMYRPGEVNESAKIYKGGKLGFNKAGELVYTDARNGVDVLSGEGKFDGEHFDFKSYQEGKISPQEFPKTDTIKPTTEKPSDFWNQNTNQTPAPEVKANVLTPEGGTVKISKDISADVDFIEKNGKVESSITTNFEQFDAYHKAYLTKDIDTYAKFLAQETNFTQANKLSESQIKESLNNYINQMIARDQILQEGGLDPASAEYKALQQERDILKSVIDKEFVQGYSEEPLFENSLGKKYPDPNYSFENATDLGGDEIETSSGPEKKSLQTEAVEPKTESQITKTRVRNNVINQEFDFKFEKDTQGRLTGYIENYKPATIPEDYFKQRLGFDPDWRKASGLSQTFEDSVEGKKIAQKIEIAKVALIGYDSFVPGTPEHDLFKRTLTNTINNLEKDYPAIFEYKN